ncbi:MAG: hypothetical protein HQL38_03405 [Alphaproteobacteria bacterium]|nr:hypothetical protein [Alphaproteobacteria bacterium]
MLIVTDPAWAGADTTFDDVWVTLSDWIRGSLGKVIALGFVGVGLISGMVRQSLTGFATGVGAGVGLYTSPDVVEEMITATLPLL